MKKSILFLSTFLIFTNSVFSQSWKDSKTSWKEQSKKIKDKKSKDSNDQKYLEALEYYQKGENELVIGLLSDLNEKQNNKSDFYILRGAAYKNLDLYNLAISDYEKAIQLDDNVLGYNNRAYIYMINKDYELAMKDNFVVINRESEMIDLGFNMGPVYHNLGICREALGFDDYCDYFDYACHKLMYEYSCISKCSSID